MAIAIIGYAGAGKGTLCKIFESVFGLPSQSSSLHAVHKFLYQRLIDPSGPYRLNYRSPEEAYADRSNCRNVWFREIGAYNDPDQTRLGRSLLANYPIYDGIRKRSEFEALRQQGLVRKVIWVEGGDRVPKESANSMELTAADADFVIYNDQEQFLAVQARLAADYPTTKSILAGLRCPESKGDTLLQVINQALHNLEYATAFHKARVKLIVSEHNTSKPVILVDNMGIDLLEVRDPLIFFSRYKRIIKEPA